MNIERVVGLVFSIGILLVLLFVVLTPQIDYQQEFKVSNPITNDISLEKENLIEAEVEKKEIFKESPIMNSDVASIEKSDFDLFVIGFMFYLLKIMQIKWSQRLIKAAFLLSLKFLEPKKIFMLYT